MKATVTSKGQITIPLAIRRRLGIGAGTVLDFDEQAKFLKATKTADRERMRAVIGIAKEALGSRSSLEWLDELRGEVALPTRHRKG